MTARITLANDEPLPTERDELKPILAAAADLVDAAAQLLGVIPPAANPVVIARQHLAELQAASDAFVEVAEGILEVRDLSGDTAEPRPEPVVDRSAGGALARAGYQDGDLNRTLIEQTQPGRQA